MARGKGEKEGEARAKEAARIVGGPYKGPGKTSETIVRKSAMAHKPQCIISRNGTLTPSVFCGLSLRRQEPHKATERTHRERAAIHGKLISRDARLRRVVNIYGGIPDSIVREFFNRDVR